MKTKWGKAGLIFLAVLILAGGSAGIYSLANGKKGSAARGESIEQTQTQETEKTRENCTLEQTYRFLNCGHTVARRILLPSSQVGLTFEEVQKQYAPWVVESFSPTCVKMYRDEKLYCPMHQVLMTDEMGSVCVFQNVYGDGMAFVKKLDCNLSVFSQEEQQEIYEGIGFDTMEELEKWVYLHINRKS